MRRPARWQVELSALGLALLAGAPLLLGRVYYLDDFHGHGLPLLAAVQRALRAGASPAWCPDVLGGYPALAAGQSGAAYPVMQALLRIFPLLTAMALFYVAHFWLLARCMLGLLLELGASFPGALAGAAVALLGGPVAGHHFHYNILVGMAWTPAVMWAAAMTGRRRDGCLPTLLLGAALGLMTLQSQPQYVLLAAEAVVCTVPWWRTEVGAGRLWLRLAAAVVIGKLLAAAQLVPEAQYILSYPRPHPGGRFEFLTEVGFGLREWLRLLQPDLLGSPMNGGWKPAPMLYWETRAFVGTGFFAVALAVLLGRRREPAVRGALCLLLVGAALAVGRWNPLYHGLVYLPPFNLFRVPARHIWLVHLAFAIAAGIGRPAASGSADGGAPDRTRTRPQERTRRAAVLLVAAAWLAALAASGASGHLGLFLRSPAPWLAALSLAAAAWRPAQPALLLFGLLELAVCFHAFAVTQPRSIYDQPPPLAMPVLASHQRRTVELGLPVRDDDQLGNIRRLQSHTGVLWGVSYLTGREAIFPTEHLALLGEMAAALQSDPAQFARLCDRSSVHWVVTAAAFGGAHWRLAAEDSGARLYENLGARPIAYAVPARYLGAGGVATRAAEPPILPVELVAPGWDRWRIRTALAEPAAVVLAQSRYPGWRVSVDGRPARLEGAERLFMSVAVPAGAHAVEFSFDNACVKAGAWLGGLGWLLWALSLLAWGWRTRRRAATAAPPAPGRPST